MVVIMTKNNLKSHNLSQEKGGGHVEPQNKHHNIKKQALGPNIKRGK